MYDIQKVGHFEKVTFEQYLESMVACNRIPSVSALNGLTDEDKEFFYDEWAAIKLPVRATSGSAGYDFCLPCQSVRCKPGESVLIPTGIRAWIQPGWYLMMLPCSGLGFKQGMRLMNTAGIIDSDYYYADNEGHIMVKVTSENEFELIEGDRFAQGIFVPHGITAGDEPLQASRSGGFGSTGK